MKNSLVKYKDSGVTFDSLVHNIWNDVLTDPFFGLTRNWRPEELSETDNEWKVEIELPRVKREEIKVEAVNRDTIKVTAKSNRISYQRVYQLSGVNAEKADVKLADGVLTVSLPKLPESEQASKVLEIK